MSCVASRPAKSLLDLLDDHGGRRDVLFLSIDLELGPSSYSGALQRRSRIPPRSSAEFVDLSIEYKSLTLKLASRLNLKHSKLLVVE